MLNLYRLTAFLSAALLFLVQPMFARQVLPLVGGAPAVWNTCQVFFQVALLAGYLYADLSTRWLGVRRQSMLHLLLILPPLLCLPLLVGNPTPPNPEANPSPWLLALLAVTVGPPFLALSATAPLVQRWFVAARRDAKHDPYSLYVMSNFGSLLALLSYPFVIEPLSTLRTQAWVWSAGYAAWVFCLAACGYFVWRVSPGKETAIDAATEPVPEPRRSDRKQRKKFQPEIVVAPEVLAPIALTWRRRLHWLALAAAPVAWMLGATTWITTDIAPIPLLWIAPLAIYLLTFMIAFSARGHMVLTWALRIMPWMMCALVASLTAFGIWQLALVHLAAFAIGAMVCHGELARLRPGAENLTEFYVWLSTGGALGGTFIALVAPLVFVTPWEYALAVAGGCALMPRITERRIPLLDLICVIGVAALLYTLRGHAASVQKPFLLMAALFGFPLMVGCYLLRRPVAFAAVLGVILAIDARETAGAWSTIRAARSYFGTHRVAAETDDDGRILHQLQHGTTAHGIQFMNDGLQCTPLVYYHRDGPLGEIFTAFEPRPGERQHIAAVGLGAGAAACYTSDRRDITFFEIDPVVRELAEDPECFTYLSKCGKGKTTIKLGDGRRLLAEEPEDKYAIILLDAFSSDAIPVHLLTREALEIYMSRLTSDGVLAFHISNNHLDLAPVLADLAHDRGWAVRVRHDNATETERVDFKTSSSYVVIARDSDHFRALADDARWRPKPASGRAVWTDDYCNVLSVLK